MCTILLCSSKSNERPKSAQVSEVMYTTCLVFRRSEGKAVRERASSVAIVEVSKMIYRCCRSNDY